MKKELSLAAQQFHQYSDDALISINDGVEVANSSRATIYRLFNSGKLKKIKFGNSTKIRVGELRRLIGVE